ncbi:MAG: DeoR/GlpR transcriptional regulator [Spirochaetaceae bacterium]|nr:MAG: DeoR/GlpR transcriptional regulator [Spirochaetaceae bacterium]
MPRNPRLDTILAILANRRQLSVSELTERLAVSEVTVRKDLARLEDAGHLIRTRGGARAAEDRTLLRTVQARRQEPNERKQLIADTAVQLIRDGETIFIDSGTTCALLAANLSGRDLRVVTNSIDVLNALGDAEGVQLYCVGGSYRREAGSFIGPAALTGMADFRFDTAFIGTSGFSVQGELSAQNVNEAQVKRAALQNATRRVILCESSKFGSQAFSVFARPADINLVVMDEHDSVCTAISALGIEILAARPH